MSVILHTHFQTPSDGVFPAVCRVVNSFCQAEFTIVLRSLLHGLRLFYNDAVMPNDAELEVAIDECFKRWAELVELWETGRRVIWWARCGGLSGHLFT